MGRFLFAGAIAIAVAGCKKDKAGQAETDRPGGKVNASPDAGAAKASAPSDAAPAVDAAAEEDVLRRGKRTGLGTADEKPEVLVEELIIAIAAGKIDAARFVDPARGFIDHVILPGGGDPGEPDEKNRLCGKKAAAELLHAAKILVKAQADGADELDHILQCDNEYLATEDPTFGSTHDWETKTTSGGHPFRYAVCSSSGAVEWDANYELVFAPDEARGLRVVGMLVWESGFAAVPWPDFADAAIKPKGCK